MTRPRRTLAALGLLAIVSAVAVSAMAIADEAPSPAGQQSRSGAGVLALLPKDSITGHTLDAGGHKLPYVATAGTLDLYDQSGKRSAAIFYTGYVAKDRTPNRPVTFAFNGGPGAASAFLNLGLVGPRILDFGPSGRDGAHARLIDNPRSWLGFTDLVMIDPIGTGWSQGVGFNQIGVDNNEDGKPALVITGEAQSRLDGLGPSSLWLSMSHTREYATATVIIERQA